MSLAIERKFKQELFSLINKNVTVKTTYGKEYSGILSSIDVETLSLCLVTTEKESESVQKIIINGAAVLQILSKEKPFDLRALAERLERVFPKMVKLIEEAEVIVVMDKVRVTEKGIIEGSGPIAERVQKIYEEFVKEHKET
ncbi:MAG: Lsm family RNA-binding protein [Candidatus Bathyarchaeia archaeon]